MMTSWSLAKYRLCMQSRRMSFQTRSVGVNSGQEVQHEAEGLLLTPKLMQMGVMVSDVIDDDHNAVAASHTDAPQITKKVKEGGGLNLFLSWRNTNRPSHSRTRIMLLKLHFIGGP